MSTTPWQNRLYGVLLRESQKGEFQRHCAYLAAGVMSLFLVRPKLPRSRPTPLAAVAGGGAVLVLALVLLAGPLLNLLQPALREAGKAPALTWPVTAALGFFGWRYVAGRTLLRSFAAVTHLA